MNVEEFLSYIHSQDNKIHFRIIKNNMSKNLYGSYSKLKQQLINYNSQGFNIYYVVNSGGTHNQDINHINAVFIDFDCGKNENNQYYSLDVTKKFKQEKLNIIHNFKIKPTFVIETRNGLHVYWCINNGTIDEYLECQERLINYFKSDNSIKDLARIMRLPDYYWCKDINNTFMCSIIEFNDVRYNIKDIIDILVSLDNKYKLNNKGVFQAFICNTKDITIYTTEKPPRI